MKYEWGKEIIPGITTIATPGHTPGHTSFIVASGSAKVLVQSDVTNIPHLFLRNPTWQVMYDVDPLKAAETRKKFYDMASAEKSLVQGFRFPFPSVGHVEKEGEQYRLVPILGTQQSELRWDEAEKEFKLQSTRACPATRMVCRSSRGAIAPCGAAALDGLE
jgi:glyoxylase-like metal-dependent hydrolase (beta-lactamase superfamily II)